MEIVYGASYGTAAQIRPASQEFGPLMMTRNQHEIGLRVALAQRVDTIRW